MRYVYMNESVVKILKVWAYIYDVVNYCLIISLLALCMVVSFTCRY